MEYKKLLKKRVKQRRQRLRYALKEERQFLRKKILWDGRQFNIRREHFSDEAIVLRYLLMTDPSFSYTTTIRKGDILMHIMPYIPGFKGERCFEYRATSITFHIKIK